MVLVGKNGAGKSRYLRLIRERMMAAQETTVDLTFHRQAEGPAEGPFLEAYESIPATIERAARALFNARHPQLADRPAVAQAAHDAEQLNAMLAALLAKTVAPEIDPEGGAVHALLGERRFNVAELSSGERILLTWAILLHRQAGALLLQPHLPRRFRRQAGRAKGKTPRGRRFDAIRAFRRFLPPVVPVKRLSPGGRAPDLPVDEPPPCSDCECVSRQVPIAAVAPHLSTLRGGDLRRGREPTTP